MRRINLRKRKVVAAAAFLLASSLEICGCDLGRQCSEVRGLPIAETDWPELARRCGPCLSSEEMRSLWQARGRLEASLAGALPDSSETVGQAILAGGGPAFYDPGGSPYESIDTSNSSGDSARGPVWPQLASFRSDDGPSSKSSRSRYDAPSWVGPQPWPIPESVFFVYTGTGGGLAAARRAPSATAFVVSVPRLDHRGRIRFLVTARHVVDPEWAHCTDQNPAAIEVRFNRSTGGSGYELIPLELNHVRQFFTPSDGSADIAVVPLDERVIPNLESYRFVDTPFRLLPTASELAAIGREERSAPELSSGRRIVTASLRTHVVSEDRDYPVYGAGMLRSTSAAPVEIRCGPASGSTPLKLWTIDAAAPQELSGAPVYTTMTRGAESTATPVLLGIQSVAWPGRPLAGITPADALGELIEEALGSSGRQMDLYRGPRP